MKIRNIMKHNPQTIACINPTASIEEASKQLTGLGIGALLVEDGNANFVGIISERDIVTGVSQNGASLQNLTVSDLMTHDLVSCDPDCSVNEAMGMMTNRRVRHLPVFEEGKLVSLVSIGDLVKYRLMEMQAETEAMRAYINS